MTDLAERIRESHRGWRQAEPAARSRLVALETFGLRFERIDDFNVLVEGQYLLNLALSYWRAEDNSCHGYRVSALDAEIRRTKIIETVPSGTTAIVIDTLISHLEKLTEGRDSVPASDRTADSTTATSAVIAESSVSPISLGPPINSWP